MAKKANLGASVSIDGEKEFKQALTQINNNLRVTASELTLVTAKYSDNANCVEALTAKQKVLGTTIESQQNKVNKLREALTAASAKYGETDSKTLKWKDSLNKAEANLISMNKDLQKTQDDLRKVTNELETQPTKLQAFGNKAQSIFNSLETKLKSIGNTLSIVGASFVAFGAVGVKSYIPFEEQFKKVTTLIDESVLSLDDARKAILDISNETGQSSANLADSLYEILSSNVSTSDSLKVLYQSAKLAEAGFTDTQTSVNIITSLMNAYGLSVQDVTKLSDQLILTQNLGKITVGQMGDSIGQVAGIAAQAKVPIADLFAAIATLTSNGVNASESITQIRSILSAIIKPTAEAKEEARNLGIQFNTTTLQTKGLSGFLEDVRLKTHGNIDAFGKLFGNVEGLNASLILTGKGATMFAASLKQINEASGQTNEAFDKLQQNNAKQFSDSINNLTNSMIQLGGALSPVIGFLAGLASALAILPKPLLVIIPIIGTLLVVGGQVLSVMASFKGVFGLVTEAGAVANVGMSAFGKKLLLIIGIVLAVVSAVTLLVLAINALTGKSDSFINSVKAASNINVQTPSNMSEYERKLGQNYTGTSNWRGGLTWVNEKGGEIIDLPSRSRIYPHDKSVQMAYQDGINATAGTENYIFQPGSIIIDAKNVRDFTDVINTVKGMKQASRVRTVMG